MQAAVNRKLRNARRLRGTVDLVVIPMAFESQGGLHPNWRTTNLEWAKTWASRSEAETESPGNLPILFGNFWETRQEVPRSMCVDVQGRRR